MNPKGNEVLVIEDDPTIQLSLQVLLENEGYVVNQALTGQQALDKLGPLDPKTFPRVVLLDLMLPDMSGEDLLAGVLSSEKLIGLPVVIISAAADAPRIAIKYHKQLLKKPFELDTVLEVVANSC